MGCDIHSYAEVKRPDGAWHIVGDVFPLDDVDRVRLKKECGSSPFNWRSYGLFGFLAGVRNYSGVPTIAEPKWDIPNDASPEVRSKYEYWASDAHTATWLTAKQLLDFDYDQVVWDRRVTKQVSPSYWNHAALADAGEGRHLTLREFLGEHFFERLKVLKSLGEPENVRIVFWFDN